MSDETNDSVLADSEEAPETAAVAPPADATPSDPADAE